MYIIHIYIYIEQIHITSYATQRLDASFKNDMNLKSRSHSLFLLIVPVTKIWGENKNDDKLFLSSKCRSSLREFNLV